MKTVNGRHQLKPFAVRLAFFTALLLITAGATSPKIPSQVGAMLFLASFGDNVQAAAGAEYSFKNFENIQ